MPYKVTIAVQGAISLEKDLEGNEIDNIFNMSKMVRMPFMETVKKSL